MAGDDSIRLTALGDFVGPMNSTMLPSGCFAKTGRRPVAPETETVAAPRPERLARRLRRRSP